jgi:23S rRNA (uridine2552-2'-O)-methyltransferase
VAVKRLRGGVRWIERHRADPYVRKARAAGYRSRAAFKLIEIDARDRLIRPGMVVIDLGAAPGSWSQVVVGKVGRSGRTIGVDLLPIEPLPGVEFVQGDIRDAEVLARLEALVPSAGADLVLSDIAPNLSGSAPTDQARSEELARIALEFASRHLKHGGTLLVKTFHGSGFEGLRAAMRAVFEQVQVRKPAASRPESAETFLLGRGRRNASETEATAFARRNNRT